MSFGIEDPVTGELAANKANKDGSDITNPQDWREALDVLSASESLDLAKQVRNERALYLKSSTASLMKFNLNRGLHSYGLTIRFPVMKIPTANPSVVRGFGGVSGNASSVEAASSLRCELKTDGTVQVTVFDDLAATRVITSATSLVSTHGGKWVDLVLVRDTTGIKLYLDGALYLSEDNAAWLVPVNLGYAHFGFCTGNSWEGHIRAGAAVLDYAVPGTTTVSGFGSLKGVAERYSEGMFLVPSDYFALRTVINDDFSSSAGWNFSNGAAEIVGGKLVFSDSTNTTVYRYYNSALWQGGERARISFESNVSGVRANFEGGSNVPWTDNYTPNNKFTTVAGINAFELGLIVPIVTSTYGFRFYAEGVAGEIDNFKIEIIGALCYFPEFNGVGRQVVNATASQVPGVLAASGVSYNPPSFSGKVIGRNQDVSGGAYLFTDASYMLPKNAPVSMIISSGGVYTSDLQDLDQDLSYRNIRLVSDGSGGVSIYRANAAGSSYQLLATIPSASGIDPANFNFEIHYNVLPDAVNGGDLTW